MFKCDWFEVEEDKYRVTSVYFNRKVDQNDPFVLDFQVQQCFYIKDPLDENRHYALKKFPIDLFNMGEQCDQSNGVEVNATNNDGELNWVRKDMSVTIFNKPSTLRKKLFCLKMILMKLYLTSWTKNRYFKRVEEIGRAHV